MNKRGMSFIAVVLLIGLVLVLGTIFFIFIREYSFKRIEEVEEKEECLDVKIKVLEACYELVEEGDDIVKVKVESMSERDIDKELLIRIIGEKEVLIPSYPMTTLEGFNIKEFVIFSDLEELGELKEVTVIPKITNKEGSQIVCSLNSESKELVEC